jgi:hypothetical protein
MLVLTLKQSFSRVVAYKNQVSLVDFFIIIAFNFWVFVACLVTTGLLWGTNYTLKSKGLELINVLQRHSVANDFFPKRISQSLDEAEMVENREKGISEQPNIQIQPRYLEDVITLAESDRLQNLLSVQRFFLDINKIYALSFYGNLIALVLIAFSEFFNKKSALWYVGIGCVSSIVGIMLSGYNLQNMVKSGDFLHSNVPIIVFFVIGGLSGGLIYWLITGRNTGHWKQIHQTQTTYE